MLKLDRLVAVTNMPGLYRMTANRPDGLIVESLDNGKRTFASSRAHQFSPLEGISMYTLTDTVPLSEVFESMLKNIEAHPVKSVKDDDESLRAYFSIVLPEYDREQVKISDIRKCLKWFNYLNDRNLLVIEPDVEPTEETPA